MAGGRAGREALLFAAVVPALIAVAACSTGDTLTPGDRLADGSFLRSSDGGFRLGFFSPGKSTSRYVGIWYNRISVQTVVWVANRENPIPDATGVLSISGNGSLSISDSKGVLYWSTPATRLVGPAAKLLPGGNFVVSGAGESAWQSFDHPTDALLPGMKLGSDRRTGLTRNLTSWRSEDDPAAGNYTVFLDLTGDPQLMLVQGTERVWRSGPWIGNIFSGVTEMRNTVFNHSFESNADEVFYQYSILDNAVVSRLVVLQEGYLERLIWREEGEKWTYAWRRPRDSCGQFGYCGVFGLCNANVSPLCSCLQGFEPSSPRNWALGSGTDGCRRKTALDCRNGTDGFVKVAVAKLPDASSSTVKENMGMDECREVCLRNCSCAGYAVSEVNSGGRSGCVIWSGELNDLRVYDDVMQDLFVRLARADMGLSPPKSKRNRVAVGLAVGASVVVVVLLVLVLGLIGWCVRRKRKRSNTVVLGSGPIVELRASKEEVTRSKEDDLSLFDLSDIAIATNNFADASVIGFGGFGPVYKGLLGGNQEIAVKRLAKSSTQGSDEFVNEVRLIAKLQHRNLVRLLGSCVNGEERILVYEYMPNGSLDSFLFDKTKASLLDWPLRLNIIGGIARGLLYLHQDSRLRIIHRDLKAGNVLLDDGMNPKISDFGMARIFSGDETEGITRRVVGTFGYMSPEYAMDGNFSTKSDVYSFGVLLLEIISGRKNRAVFHSDHKINLLGGAWNLWKEGRGLEVVDSALVSPIPAAEVLKCLKIGLLCVQERPEDRPEMAAVVVMLGGDSAALPHPKAPGFVLARDRHDASSSGSTVNNVTVTTVHAR